MKRSTWVVILTLGPLLGALAVRAQTSPSRAPVVLAQPPPTPTPNPPPPPFGIFSGSPTGTVQANGRTTTNSLGTWRLNLPFSVCGDCDPNQYDITFGTYQGVGYANGQQETGTIFGIVNPSGRIVGFNLLATNCLTLNPNSQYVSNPGLGLAGYYYGGTNGEAPGPTLTYALTDFGFGAFGYTISGRVSGRDCFNQIIVTDVQLRRQ